LNPFPCLSLILPLCPVYLRSLFFHPFTHFSFLAALFSPSTLPHRRAQAEGIIEGIIHPSLHLSTPPSGLPPFSRFFAFARHDRVTLLQPRVRNDVGALHPTFTFIPFFFCFFHGREKQSLFFLRRPLPSLLFLLFPSGRTGSGLSVCKQKPVLPFSFCQPASGCLPVCCYVSESAP